jgi:predicted Fe-Mo cluster-binding NifX family protein
MKIAVAHWQRRVSPVFDVADHLFLITVDKSREIQRESLLLASRDPFERAKTLAGCGVEVLLCGAVSLEQEKALAAAGIRVMGFLGGQYEDILDAYLDGRLNDGRAPRADLSGQRPRGAKQPDPKKGPRRRFKPHAPATKPLQKGGSP